MRGPERPSYELKASERGVVLKTHDAREHDGLTHPSRVHGADRLWSLTRAGDAAGRPAPCDRIDTELTWRHAQRLAHPARRGRHTRAAGQKQPGPPVRAFGGRMAVMLGWVLLFLVLALVAAAFGFVGVAGLAVGIAQILFVVFLVLLLVSLIAHLTAGRRVL